LQNRENVETFISRDSSEFDKGDLIEISALQLKLKDTLRLLEEENLYRFGLSQKLSKSMAWVTYQFTHAGAMHLLSNIVFLVVVGLSIELLIGSVATLLLYLVGGFFGGVLFLLLSPHGLAPMVGGSASISAFLAAYPILESRRRVRFYYMIVPFDQWHGFIYLSPLVIYSIYLLSDITALIASGLSYQYTSVAYSAHLGGAIAGVLFATVLKFADSKFSLKGKL
jgi:membrane associated rhomboid family serine protease